MNNNLISIPTAVYNPWFEWQLDLFWHNHKKVYGRDSYRKAHAVIIKRNKPNENKCEIMNWKTDIPHTLCDSHFDFDPSLSNSNYIPINIQIGLKQIIHKFADDDLLEILDCDLFHLKKHPNFNLKFNEVYACDLYESWHLFSLGKHKIVIEKYFKNEGKYYNGGFVPIVIRTYTLKKIIDDWIQIHKDIVDNFPEPKFGDYRWWAGMYSFQAACERNKIKMFSNDYCYFPNINQIIENHYIAHYSCDPKFNKKKYPDIDYSTFLDNTFYSSVLDWKQKSLASRSFYKMFL